MNRLRKRLQRLETLEDVEKVFADTCCEGMADPSKHMVVDLFPNVKRAPYADLFHKTQIVCSHMLSSHPLHAAMSGLVAIHFGSQLVSFVSQVTPCNEHRLCSCS